MKTKLYFSADWHIGHENVLHFDNRPFKDLDDMHESLIKNFNYLVPDHGITYFLGDMGLCSNGLLKSVIERLNGTKILIRGNHDGKMDSMYNAGFDVVLEKGQITLGKTIVTMSHCPLKGVHREYVKGMRGNQTGNHWHNEHKYKDQYGFEDFGQLHLSGHIHSPNSGKSIRELGRQFDVGVPANNFKPVGIDEIQSWASRVVPLNNDWRDVVGYPGYKVNGLGEVVSFRRFLTGRRIKPYVDKDGYLCISMRRYNSSKTEKVHRVVAKAFIPNPDNKPQVNHKNGHKLDCSVPNLEWSSNLDNQRHAWDTGLKVSKLTVSQVSNIKEKIRNGSSNQELSQEFKVDPSTISNIRIGRTWKRVK